MSERRAAGLLVVCLALSACTASVSSGSAEDGASAVRLPIEGVRLPIEGVSGAAASETTVDITTTVAPSSTVQPVATTEQVSTTTPTTTPPTTTEPPPEIYDPVCVVEVQPFDSLRLIGDRFDDETVNVVSLRAENGLPDADIDDGQLLDVCVGNGLNDITGEQRVDPDEEVVAAAVRQNVEIQQLVLNRLFEGLGPPDLLVDGVSGPVTRQRLCAARLALGLPTSTANMAAGSAEERALLAARTLPVPVSSATQSNRWVLIDRTCQIMFAGEGPDTLRYVFPTSTGSAGFETRDQDRSRAFRFDPALDNGGWHNSTDFPVAGDNPLNGNMYRPLYFDLGQAIHGANNVPTSPQSKGCARLRVGHQDTLVSWLDLAGARSPIWNRNEIGVTVNVQGTYVPR